MPRKISRLNLSELSIVDAPANPKAKVVLFKRGAEKPIKTEDGNEYTAEDYLYVPDPEKPSTWKLRIAEYVDGRKQVTARQVGRAIAALSPGGFRGNRVELPDEAVSQVKAKLRRLWRQFHQDADESEMPEHIRKGGERMEESVKERLWNFVKGLIGKAEDGAMDFDEARMEQQFLRNWWDTVDALRASIESILRDDAVTDKQAAVQETLGQFEAAVLAILSGSGVSKVGRKISAERLARLKAMREELNKLIAEAEPVAKEGDRNMGDVNKQASQPVEVPEEVRKRLDELEKAAKENEELRKRLAEAEQIAKAEREARLNKEYVEKAAKEYANIAKAEELGPVLRAVDEKLEKAEAERLHQWLKAANERIEKGALFAELGRSAPASTGSVYERVRKMAEELVQKSERKLTIEQAMDDVLKQNPELEAEYLKEVRG